MKCGKLRALLEQPGKRQAGGELNIQHCGNGLLGLRGAGGSVGRREREAKGRVRNSIGYREELRVGMP